MAEAAPSREAIETNWDALTNAFEGKKLEQESPAPEKPEEKPTTEEAPPELKIEEKPTEEKPTEEKPEGEKSAEEKPAEEAGAIKFSVEDIEGVEQEAPEGSWFAVAKEAGLKIENDSFEDFKKALIDPYIKQVEEAKTMTVENLFSGLKPETVAAFKLMEMGIPEDKLFEPTKEIDNYLAMDAAELIRADKEALKWAPEMIDAELELLTTKNLLNHEADKIRMALSANREAILQERQSYIEQYESKKEQAILAQKEQEKTHFKQAMDTVSSFMDVPVPSEVKEAVMRKFNSGAYDNLLTTPESKAEYILYKELGQKIAKTLKSTAFAQGKETIRKNLLAVPPATNNNAGQQQVTNQDTVDPWSAVDKMAKALGH